MECAGEKIAKHINQKTDEILRSIKTQLANAKLATAQTSDTLDTAYHCIAYKQFNFDVISHIQNKELIPDIIPNLYEKYENTVFNDFTSYVEYFRKHFWGKMNTEVFTMPNLDENISHAKSVSTTHICTIMSTMKSWCNKNQKGDFKGFITYAYSYSKSLRFSESVLQNNLYKTTCEDFHETIIVYNPTKQLVFLLRLAIGKNLEDEIKLSTNDMMKFVFTFFDILVKSGVRLINLLVIDKEVSSYQLNCDSCEHQIISIKSFSSSKSFDLWWEKKEQQFTISVIHKDLNENFSSGFLAKLGGYLVPLQFVRGNHSPGEPSLHLNYSIEKMAGVLKMTPEQTRIVYLPQKHLIIKGSNGSGKTVVACKRAELIARSMTKNDSLYYIICDSRSMLKEEIQLPPEINVFHNLKQEQESTLVEQILNSDSKNGKINLIFDEFYGENLGEKEVKQLNQKFKTNERLKNSHVIFIAQPLIMESGMTETIKKGNMLEMLGSMNPPEVLNDNMRNPVEINRLVTATRSALEDQPIFYPNPNAKRNSSESSHLVPSLYEIPYTEGKVKPKILLMFILRKVMNAIKIGNQLNISHIEHLTVTQGIKKLAIIHFDSQNDIPNDFNIVFKLMGVSKRVTSKYDEFKEDPNKEIFICNYRTFRGLQYSHIIVVFDSSLCFLQHYLPECFSRCTEFLHIIVLNLVQSQKREVTFQRLVQTWKRDFDGQQSLVMHWKIKTLEFEECSVKVSQPVDSVSSKEIRIRIKADVYTEIKKEIDKSSTATTEKLEEASNKPKEIEIRIIALDRPMKRYERYEVLEQNLKSSKQRLESLKCKVEWIERYFAWLERYFAWLERYFGIMEQHYEWMEPTYKWMEPTYKIIGRRFEIIDRHLEIIEQIFDIIEQHSGLTELELGLMETRFEMVEDCFGWMEKGFGGMEKGFGWMEKRFGWMEKRFEMVEDCFGWIEKRFGLKGPHHEPKKYLGLKGPHHASKEVRIASKEGKIASKEGKIASKEGKIGDSSGPSD